MKLGEVIKINQRGIKKNYPYKNILYADISSVGEGVVGHLEEIILADAPSRAKRIVLKNDTILSTVRPRNRSFYYFKEAQDNLIASTGFAVLTPIKEYINERFLYYLISNRSFTSYLGNHEKGAAYPAITTDVIENYELELPILETQKRIADILSAYDDLIENNLKRIKLLEQAAQNIYKEWFVHLRFPGHENTAIDEETGLPVGWEEKKLNEITSLITKGTTPTSVGYKFTEEGINFIKAESYNDNGFFKRNKFAHISNEAHQKLKRSQLKKDDIIFSIAGVIGRCAIIKSELLPANTNQAVAIIRLSETYNNFPSFIKYSLSQKSVRDYTNAIRVQAAQANINLKQLGQLKIIIPTNEMVIRYNDVVSYNVKQMNILFKYNQKLKAARDILLPRLMNRMIEV